MRAAFEPGERRAVSRDHRVAGILAREERADPKSRRRLGGEILERVDGQIDASHEERLLDFFCEKPLALHFVKTDVLDEVALRFDDGQLAVDAEFGEFGAGKFGLPEGELAAAGADAKGFLHGIFIEKNG